MTTANETETRQLITDHVQQYQTKLHTGQNIYYLLTFHLSEVP